MRSLARISKSIKAHEKGLDKDFADLTTLMEREQKATKPVAKRGRPAKAKKVKAVKTKSKPKAKKGMKPVKATGAKRGRPPGSKNKTKTEAIVTAGDAAPIVAAPVVADAQVPATV